MKMLQEQQVPKYATMGMLLLSNENLSLTTVPSDLEF
jgi:hypothetical protein